MKETPDKLAVVSDGGRMLTYAQLNRSCDILADWLRSKVGVKADVGVGIYLERSVEYVISYVAILKAGTEKSHFRYFKTLPFLEMNFISKLFLQEELTSH